MSLRFLFMLPILFTQVSFATYEDYSRKELLQHLNIIPHNDLQLIKNLFHHLFYYNEIGFTLFGDKPVSFCQPSFEEFSSRGILGKNIQNTRKRKCAF